MQLEPLIQTKPLPAITVPLCTLASGSAILPKTGKIGENTKRW
jgi:hypothetical protein